MKNFEKLVVEMNNNFKIEDIDDLVFINKFKELDQNEELLNDIENNNFIAVYEPINDYYTVGRFYIDILDEKYCTTKKYVLTLKYIHEQIEDMTELLKEVDNGRDIYIPNVATIEIDVMDRVEYVEYKENLCFKCLQEKDDIQTYELSGRGYGSEYQNEHTKLQLCEECIGSIKKHEELKKWFYEKPEYDDDGCGENYKYENEIADYIKTLPIQGQEIFENQILVGAPGYLIDSQDWIDRKLGLIAEDETEINENINKVACTSEDKCEEIDYEDEDFDI